MGVFFVWFFFFYQGWQKILTRETLIIKGRETFEIIQWIPGVVLSQKKKSLYGIEYQEISLVYAKKNLNTSNNFLKDFEIYKVDTCF